MRLISLCKNICTNIPRCKNQKFVLLQQSLRGYCTSKEGTPIEHIRNFCIIAHVDHGKSTLADRILEITGAIHQSKENKQVLDRLPVERERGITVKAVSASLNYTYNDISYQLNLIDTPGHVDFSNEVSRSLSACQGVILLIDANEGVQAQTVANFYLAFEKGLIILPVLNKIDLPHADPDGVEQELKSLFDIEPSTVKRISAKTGEGVEEILKLIIEKVPYPRVSREESFRALIVDSWFDNFRGSVLFIYITGGTVRVGCEITSHKTGKSYQVKTVGKLYPDEGTVKVLRAGEVGVLSCSMKDSKETFVGDTIYAKGSNIAGDIKPLPVCKPMVFAGLFPKNQSEREDLKVALDKLLLNDPSVTAQTENSPALGSGWLLGFLGYLHLDVFRQRLEQEFDKEVVLTAPSVSYRVKVTGVKNIKRYGGEEVNIRNPNLFPEPSIITEMYEPIIIATIISPIEYFEIIFEECKSRRGVEKESNIVGNNRIMIKFTMPLSEIVLDFHDKLKKITSGYASFDYEDAGYAQTVLKKMVILLNGKEVEELTQIVHSSRAIDTGKKMVAKLKELVPRQQVAIAIQACVGGKVLARENIKPFRKDVTHKLHGGGDITRRLRLIKAQSEGKKKMRTFANIEIPRDTFIDVLREH